MNAQTIVQLLGDWLAWHQAAAHWLEPIASPPLTARAGTELERQAVDLHLILRRAPLLLDHDPRLARASELIGDLARAAQGMRPRGMIHARHALERRTLEANRRT